MKIIMHSQLDLSTIVDDLIRKLNNQTSINKQDILVKSMQKMKDDAKSILKPSSFLENIYIDRENPSVFAFQAPSDKGVLILPLLVSINDYSLFIKELLSINKSSYGSVGYYHGRTPFISKTLEKWKSIKMPVDLWAISSNSISVAINLSTHPMNTVLEHLAQKIGYGAIATLFPQLSGIEFKSERTVVERKEYYLSQYNNIIY